MAQFELRSGQSIKVGRGMVRATVVYGDVPIDVRLRVAPADGPLDSSGEGQLWTQQGRLWVGTFGRPSRQLPTRATLVLGTTSGGEFPLGQRLIATFDFGSDQVSIEPRDLGGLTEIDLVQLEFDEVSVTIRGAETGDPCGQSAAVAALRSARGASEPRVQYGSVAVVVDRSASMLTPDVEVNLRSLSECISALACVVWRVPEVRAIPLSDGPAEGIGFDLRPAGEQTGSVHFVSGVEDPRVLASLIRENELLFIVTDDIPGWCRHEDQVAPLIERACVVLVGYPGPVPASANGIPLVSWSAVATESKEALAIPVRGLVSPFLAGARLAEAAHS